MVDIWREAVKVRFGSVDRSDRLTLWGIFNFFQEAAISHATDLGVGLTALAETGKGWVLSRLSLFVERRPACEELIEISTWPRSMEKLFALRDYTIRDSKGVDVVRGRGAWLILDVEKRRPLRPQLFFESLPANEGINAFHGTGASVPPASLKGRENLSKKSERTALYSDIDFYGHANNARYIQWIQDAAEMDVLTDAVQYRLDINYLSEVLPGDTIELWTGPIEDYGQGVCEGELQDYPARPALAFAFEGRRPGQNPDDVGQAVFRAELRTGS